jgi:hypothetical protein
MIKKKEKIEKIEKGKNKRTNERTNERWEIKSDEKGGMEKEKRARLQRGEGRVPGRHFEGSRHSAAAVAALVAAAAAAVQKNYQELSKTPPPPSLPAPCSLPKTSYPTSKSPYHHHHQRCY